MDKLNHTDSFKDLVVYKKAQNIANQIFEITKTFPREEKYSLTDQIRRSSRSVGAQIAEAWAKRRYIKHFISKLTDADGKQLETQHWIDTSGTCGYLRKEQTEYFNEELCRIGKMLNSMMTKADLFCKNNYMICKDGAEYFGDNR